MAEIIVNGTSLGQREFEIVSGVSDLVVAPTAQFTAQPREQISANDDVEIVIEGTTRFDGIATSGGKIQQSGGKVVQCEHPAAALFEDSVTFVEPQAVSDQIVLERALTESEDGGNFTLDYAGTSTTLDSDYSVENRSVKSVFRDMTDRTGRIWWVEPASNIIHVEPRGDRGRFIDLNDSGSNGRIDTFESGNVDTVVNDVAVNATAGENAPGSASDAGSITQYGRRSKTVNIAYADTTAEANAYAQSILVPEPLVGAEVRLNPNAGAIEEPLANYTIDIASAAKGIDEDGLLIEKQTITERQAKLDVGEGAGINYQDRNRTTKSRGDVTEPGSIMPTDRIGNLSITETKITDEAVSTPKLAANAVIANKIASNTITANEIDVLDLDAGELSVTGSGLQIEFEVEPQVDPQPDRMSIYPVDATGVESTLGLPTEMNEWQFAYLSTVRPATDETGTVGSSIAAYDQMHAYEFIAAGSGTVYADGGDPLAGLAEGTGPPDFARREREGGGSAVSLTDAAMAVWDVCREQQRRIEALEQRISKLEQ